MSERLRADSIEEARSRTASQEGEAFDLDGDTLRAECGVFGIFGHPDAAHLAYQAFNF